MDDLTQVARFRDEVPAEIDLTMAERRIMARVSERPAARPRPLMHRRYVLALAGGGLATALAAGTVVAQNLPDGGGHRAARTGTPTLGPSNSVAEVALNARLVAATIPYAPRSDQWLYRRTLSAGGGPHRTS